MKITKVSGPPKKRLGSLKNGALFERADVETPCTTYMKVRHDRTVEIDTTKSINYRETCSYVIDLKNSIFKAMDDDTEVTPLEQDDSIVVREL